MAKDDDDRRAVPRRIDPETEVTQREMPAVPKRSLEDRMADVSSDETKRLQTERLRLKAKVIEYHRKLYDAELALEETEFALDRELTEIEESIKADEEKAS